MQPIFSEYKQKGFSPLQMGMQEASLARYNTGLFCWNGYQLEHQKTDGLVVLQIIWTLL